ncbi:MAG: hypothetical protein M3522_02705, partial [Actinomycetota bacterium]|nr:hypothetical protein [Actinomycetota bacterium]
YGALWTWIEVLAASLTGGVAGALLLTKALVVAASLGCAALVWIILGRVRPEDQLLGTLVYLWNPLIVVEFAAEGHNDALMILFVLLSLLFTVTARPALSVMGVVLGVLVKYLPVIFSPAQAIYLWRTRQSTQHLALSVSLALVLGLLLTAALYGPFWIGADTFGAVRQQGLPFLAPTPSGILYWVLLQVSPPGDAAALTLRVLGVLFLMFVLVAGWRARDAAALLRACAAIARLPACRLRRHLALVRGTSAGAHGAHAARHLPAHGARRDLYLAPGGPVQQPRKQPLRRLGQPHRDSHRRQRDVAARHPAAAQFPALERQQDGKRRGEPNLMPHPRAHT